MRYESHFKGKNVASIYNHPKGFLSAPSGENFQILEMENEDYELICGYDEFWILEAKGVFDKEVVEEIRSETRTLYQYSLNYKGDINDVYSEFLIKFISDEIL
ncbi:hypothetical protein [Methanobrevibacter sp. UBA212]|uniref:hypothetical protein n=1 Tax=Methanobrevibacter sp. UBA212 TaxID=1915476 RepID=UPI002600CA35|nr:hypothetical protein [Methanobrevibacter sp. UBA212]